MDRKGGTINSSNSLVSQSQNLGHTLSIARDTLAHIYVIRRARFSVKNRRHQEEYPVIM